MLSIGLMSGTSMDGVDAALLETDGERAILSLGHIYLPYPPSFQAALKASGHHPAQVLIDDSTNWHIQAVEQLLKQTNHHPQQIGVIGYHGQTVLHQPSLGITRQIGDGQRMANHFDITVVNDFRSNDMKHGGQGAPLAPLYHHALIQQYPIAIVNCGGIANISYIPDAHPENIIGFDTGPGNGLIDRYLQAKTQEMCDYDGKYGLAGQVNQIVLTALYKKHENFLSLPHPKSLDINDLHLVPELDHLSLQDACATLAAFTASTIADSIKHMVPCILTGGGAKNPAILRELKQRVSVQTADAIGWNTQALEAELFAWLAVRSLKNLPLSLPNITGVSKPVSGGTHYKRTT